jgi:hypothetical protein
MRQPPMTVDLKKQARINEVHDSFKAFAQQHLIPEVTGYVERRQGSRSPRDGPMSSSEAKKRSGRV